MGKEKRGRRWNITPVSERPLYDLYEAARNKKVRMPTMEWQVRTRALRVIATASRPPVVVSRPGGYCELEYGVKCRFCGTTQWGFGTNHAARAGVKTHLHIKDDHERKG